MSLWTPSGSAVTGQNRFHFPLSLSVSPTAGDILVLAVSSDFAVDPSIVAISGAVVAWKQFHTSNTSPFPTNEAGATTNIGSYLLWGVATGGASTISLSTANNGTAAIVQGFTPTSTASEDTNYAVANGGAAAGNYPAITPNVPGELFVATLATRDSSVPGGSQAGFTYIDYYPNFIGGMQLVYNLNASGSNSPPWAIGASSDFASVDGFLIAGAANGNFFLLMRGQA